MFSTLSPAIEGLRLLTYRMDNVPLSQEEVAAWKEIRPYILDAVTFLKDEETKNAYASIKSALLLRESYYATSSTHSGELQACEESLRALQAILHTYNEDRDLDSVVFRLLSNWWHRQVHFYIPFSLGGGAGYSPFNILFLVGLVLACVPLIFSTFSLFPNSIMWALPMFILSVIVLLYGFRKSSLQHGLGIVFWGNLWLWTPPLLFAILTQISTVDTSDTVVVPAVGVWLSTLLCFVVLAFPVRYFLTQRKLHQYDVFSRIWLRWKGNGKYELRIQNERGEITEEHNVTALSTFFRKILGDFGAQFFNAQYGACGRFNRPVDSMWFSCFPRLISMRPTTDGSEAIAKIKQFFMMYRVECPSQIFKPNGTAIAGVTENTLREYFASNPPCCEPPGYEEFVASHGFEAQ